MVMGITGRDSKNLVVVYKRNQGIVGIMSRRRSSRTEGVSCRVSRVYQREVKKEGTDWRAEIRASTELVRDMLRADSQREAPVHMEREWARYLWRGYRPELRFFILPLFLYFLIQGLECRTYFAH